jgi:hypothetical protein
MKEKEAANKAPISDGKAPRTGRRAHHRFDPEAMLARFERRRRARTREIDDIQRLLDGRTDFLPSDAQRISILFERSASARKLVKSFMNTEQRRLTLSRLLALVVDHCDEPGAFVIASGLVAHHIDRHSGTDGADPPFILSLRRALQRIGRPMLRSIEDALGSFVKEDRIASVMAPWEAVLQARQHSRQILDIGEESLHFIGCPALRVGL